MRAWRVPLRSSLVGRLMATSLAVAVAAIVATAWLATQTTTTAIRQEQSRSLADDKNIYDVLIGYAATHKDWTGIDKVIAAQAAKVGRRITLTTEDRQVIADSSAGPSLSQARPSATVDPLRLDRRLTGGTDLIDPRVAGPFTLSAEERVQVRKSLSDQLDCMRSGGVDGRVVDGPDGRPKIQLMSLDNKRVAEYCEQEAGEAFVTRPERQKLNDLGEAVAGCLGVRQRDAVIIDRDFSVAVFDDRWSRRGTAEKAQRCLQQARQVQLRPYVAKPALLFVTEPGGTTAEPVFRLSRENVTRIVWVTAAVLLAAVLVTTLVGRRLVRPLRALTAAAAGPADRYERMPVTGRDEIGYLARALNDLAERRERAEAQRRAMVGDVAHELRSPLTNIRSWLEAAQDGLTPTGPQLIDLLHEEALLLQHIIDDLADLAAADAGSLRVHPEQVYVRDLLTQVAEAQAASPVDVKVAMDGDPVVEADPARFRQMVGNLVSNAVRHTPAGGSVTVGATVAAGDLTVTVTDTGVGIAPDDLPRIFDRFWRADSSRNRATGGSGLGLPIARQLAEAHGGTITARSTPGEGTTMTVRLPVSSRPQPIAAHIPA